MKVDRKQEWLHIAEVMDANRVIPRLFLAICLAWTIWLTVYLVIWYCMLPDKERGATATGFGALALWATFNFLNKVFDRYSAGGRDWTGQPLATTTTVAASTTTTVKP